MRFRGREIAARHRRAPACRAAGAGHSLEARSATELRQRRGERAGRRGTPDRPRPRCARPSRRGRVAPAPCSSMPGPTASPRRAASAAASCLPMAAARMLDAADPLAGETFLVVADLQGKAQNARITAAAAIDEADIRAALGDRIETRTRNAASTSTSAPCACAKPCGSAPSCCRSACCRRRRGADADRAILDALREHGLVAAAMEQGGRDAAAAAGLAASRARRALARCFRRGADRVAWTTGCCPSCPARRPSRASIPARLHAGLMSLVPHDLQRKIDALAPTHFDAPSGSQRADPLRRRMAGAGDPRAGAVRARPASRRSPAAPCR